MAPLPTVGLLLIVGRELLPTRAKDILLDWGRTDMLPLFDIPLRPLLGKAWLIEPVELPCLTLAT